MGPPAKRVVREGFVLYAGRGLYELALLPVRALLADALRDLDAPERERGLALRIFDDQEPDVALELLEQKFGRQRLVAAFVQSLEWKKVPATYRALARIALNGIVTEGIDPLERAFTRRKPIVATSSNIESAMPLLEGSPFIVLKLFGDLSEPNSVLLTQRELQRILRRNSNLQGLINWLVEQQDLLFVGASPSTIQNVLSQYTDLSRRRHHVALLPTGTDASVRELLTTRYGVEIRDYDHSDARSAQRLLETFDLREALARPAERGPVYRLGPASDGPLRTLSVENIGPFEAAEISLEAGWNVILGDNGVGKSALIRAIALAIAFDSPAAEIAATNLLNSRAKRGSIAVTFGKRRIHLELYRTSRGVRIESAQLSPLDTMRRVVLGFPALRGISARELPGPSPSGETTDSKAGGVAPLLLGDADSRLNDVEQLIVNAFAQENARRQALPEERARSFAGALFHVFESLTPGLEVSFVDVHLESWKVLVDTPDGRIPIDFLSQGLRSTYNWVGELVRVLFRTFHKDPNPLLGPALVLIDEVDAHLHPEWQQVLAPRFASLFPNTQVIATTHSPLVVSSLDHGNVIVARREEPNAAPTLTRRNLRFQHLRADQLLTSDLFGLRTSRSGMFQDQIDRYVALASQAELSVEDESELVALRQFLEESLETGESPFARDHARLLGVQIKAIEEALKAGGTSSLTDRISVDVEELERRHLPGSKAEE